MGFEGARDTRFAAMPPAALDVLTGPAVLKAAPIRLTAMASKHRATSAKMGMAAMTAE